MSTYTQGSIRFGVVESGGSVERDALLSTLAVKGPMDPVKVVN